MKPEYWIAIFTVLASGSFSYLAAYLVYRVNSKRLPSQNRQEDSVTILNLTKATDEQTKLLLESRESEQNMQRKLDDILGSLKGYAAFGGNFSVADLLATGRAEIKNGAVQLLDGKEVKSDAVIKS